MDKSLEYLNNTKSVGKIKQPAEPTYNGFKNWKTWSAVISIQNDKTVEKIASKPAVTSFDKLLKQVLNLQSETLHGVDWIDPEIDGPTIDRAVSEWPAFRSKDHRFNSL